ncbi:sulfate adenylyltransferase [Hydrogenovibrio sp. SC-1]|uniref:transglutaminase-like cysteine peptidase n=1 Tax=Hydrogenovibrio sp. SC-1 TaxID=2065820 RepID=UPI000C7A7F1A|nr:transglutaminase-like cysteine peptidase [Hydrogenovibrio sp. SC-1]PLA73550.1 sulfate adenylyltransferase [Hydrogenovibrio sp. SC-1]
MALTRLTSWLWLIPLVSAIGLGSYPLAATSPQQVVTQKDLQKAQKTYGILAKRRLEAWQSLIDKYAQKPERLVLQKVNDFFNQARFTNDLELWGKSDYWATPFEFLGIDAGDCEDYVIAKYFTLKAMGVDESKLYLTYVKAVRLKQAHMVLTYFKTPKSIPLVLDNLTDRILKATQRNDLIPIYSFNGDGLWLSKQRGKGQAVSGGTDQLKNWNRLLQRMAP